jgi:hypothetical protein
MVFATATSFARRDDAEKAARPGRLVAAGV